MQVPSHSRQPLAEKMRPRAPDDLKGQERIWSSDAPLRRLVESGRCSALLFWGPPGVGKTSLAQLIAGRRHQPVAYLSAVTHGVKDIRAVITASEESLKAGGPPTLMFMDEIHRLSRNQQDVLLPALEQGNIHFIGATTENPSFEVNSAILSRLLVFRFERLADTALVAIARRALAHPESGLARSDVGDDVLAAIAKAADGDGRRVLNLLDAVTACAPVGVSPVNMESLRGVAQELNLRYDQAGDEHYDTISAFIKSIRASQPDAAVYYLARMLAAGEDPVFIARRLVIAASEDIGNANPTALLLATSAMDAAHKVGMPEARIILAQATTYLAASPKSNRAYLAINQAMADVESSGSLPIPLVLRNAPTRLLREFGHGAGYAYAHADPVGAAAIQYLPPELTNRRYYEPTEAGAEAQLKRTLAQYRQREAEPAK